MHLHCTKKLIEQLGLPTADLEAGPPRSNRLLAWHAHIVFIARNKTLIAVNDQTFYAITMPRVRKMSLKRFEDEFRSALSVSLRREGFQEHHLDSLFGERIFYAKTFDRQVLGIINEAVYHIRYLIESRSGWERVGITELTKEINHTPWLAGTRKCVFPVEKIADDLKVLLH